jgi:hypothetical protein
MGGNLAILKDMGGKLDICRYIKGGNFVAHDHGASRGHLLCGTDNILLDYDLIKQFEQRFFRTSIPVLWQMVTISRPA